jgi:Icc-related predicted phosphoesterase
MLKCLHLSDIHGFHDQINVKGYYDCIFITGDVTNSNDTKINKEELDNFLAWIYNYRQHAKYIIMIPGNHDVSIPRLGLKDYVESFGIKCLINEEFVIELPHKKFKVFGSPFTPTYGNNWAYNLDRNKLSKVWELIPLDTDILLTHGPPKGILDLSYDKNNNLEMCGDKSLLNKIETLKPYFVNLFGHIHDCKDIQNYGMLQKGHRRFFNSAMVKDGRYDLGLIHEGQSFYVI